MNDENSRNILTKLEPDIIIVNGMRIIKEQIIKLARKDILNIHTRIVPKYREILQNQKIHI
ncbi:MAG TPA: formyltransferase family protein [bacterium]|nr:formyltransferase family protein [bacterium]HOL48842.1 formyltransferase family protein [bacterium]